MSEFAEDARGDRDFLSSEVAFQLEENASEVFGWFNGQGPSDPTDGLGDVALDAAAVGVVQAEIPHRFRVAGGGSLAKPFVGGGFVACGPQSLRKHQGGAVLGPDIASFGGAFCPCKGGRVVLPHTTTFKQALTHLRHGRERASLRGFVKVFEGRFLVDTAGPAVGNHPSEVDVGENTAAGNRFAVALRGLPIAAEASGCGFIEPAEVSPGFGAALIGRPSIPRLRCREVGCAEAAFLMKPAEQNHRLGRGLRGGFFKPVDRLLELLSGWVRRPAGVFEQDAGEHHLAVGPAGFSHFSQQDLGAFGIGSYILSGEIVAREQKHAVNVTGFGRAMEPVDVCLRVGGHPGPSAQDFRQVAHADRFIG